jgi:hypothetical protein
MYFSQYLTHLFSAKLTGSFGPPKIYKAAGKKI